MIDLNNIVIRGRLTADPETKSVGDKDVSKFTLAVNDGFKEDHASFCEVESWGKLSGVCSYLKKGSDVIIIGSIRQDRWKDQDGLNRSKIKIVSKEIIFGSRKKSENSETTDPATFEDMGQEKDFPF